MRIAVVLSRIPYPLEKGDKLRAYHQLTHLATQHEIHLFCLTDTDTKEEHIAHLRSFCKQVHVFRLQRWKIFFRLTLALFSSLPFQVHYFFDRSINKKLRKKILDIAPDRIFCQLIRTCEYVKDLHGIDKTLDYMDTFSKGMQRRKESAAWYLKPFVAAEYKRLLQYENRMFDYFEKKIIISVQDRDLIPHRDKQKIYVVPNGVDTNYFKPLPNAEKKYDILFHGNLSYAPNVECVRYIIEEILPVIHQQQPCTLLVSGAAPGAKIKKLCSRPLVTLAGWVDDVRTSYTQSQMLLAPFTTGTGLQNKLLEGMAMGLPCITSPLCFNALQGAKINEDVLVGQSTAAYAQLVLMVLHRSDLREKLEVNGRVFAETHYSWKSANTLLESIVMQ